MASPLPSSQVRCIPDCLYTKSRPGIPDSYYVVNECPIPVRNHRQVVQWRVTSGIWGRREDWSDENPPQPWWVSYVDEVPEVWASVKRHGM
jgi:hypothetical protein